MPITLVSAVNNEEILGNNLMASPCFLATNDHQILIQRGFSSAARAYNKAIACSVNDLIVFAHQDVVFPRSWLSDLDRALHSLEGIDPKWGVLGCYGVTVNGKGRGYIYSNGLGILGNPFDGPAPVQTLDEIVLIIRNSSGLQFDQNLPHFHFYGADICMAAAERGMKSYAISAHCIHNSQQNLVLPKEFYQGYKHIRHRWRKFLPIQTTCVRITRFNFCMYERLLRESYLRYIRRKEIGATRVDDGRELLADLEGLHPETTVADAENGRCECPELHNL
jgi:hypothetical protein